MTATEPVWSGVDGLFNMMEGECMTVVSQERLQARLYKIARHQMAKGQGSHWCVTHSTVM